MDSENIITNVEGFLKGIPYHADLYQFLKGYKDKFGHAESMEVSLEEIPYTMLSFPNSKKAIDISPDGKKVSINYTTSKHYDGYGKVISVPIPIDVYRGLKILMNKAVVEYANKFNNQ